MAHKDGDSIRIRVWVGGRKASKNVPANTPAREIEALKTKMKLGLLDPKKIKVLVPTFKSHSDAWLKVADVGFSTKKKHAQNLRDHLIPILGRLRIDEITPAHCVDLAAHLGTKLGPQSVGNVLSTASGVFKDAILRGHIQVSPLAGVKRVKRKRDQLADDPLFCWSLAERDRFLAHCRDADWKVFQVAAFTLFTGLRPGEVRGLKGDCIDWNASTIMVKRQFCTKQGKIVEYTKGRRRRTVPIPRPILELLRDRPHGPDDQLFAETINSYGHNTLRPLMAAAGVVVVTFHGLRHTFASQLYEVTKDVLLVRDTLGHTNVATTNRYLHRLTNKVSGATDGLLAGASFLNQPGTVVPMRR